MRSLLSGIVAGEEPSPEQSDFLDGLDVGRSLGPKARGNETI